VIEVGHGEIQVAVIVRVAPGQVPTPLRLVRGPDRRQAEGGTHVLVEPIGLIMVGHRQIEVAVAIPIAPGSPFGHLHLVGDPGRSQVARAVVGVEPVGPGVAQQQIEVAVVVHVAPRPGSGCTRSPANSRLPWDRE